MKTNFQPIHSSRKAGFLFRAIVAGISFSCLSLNPSFAATLNDTLMDTYLHNPALEAAREEAKSTHENMPQALSEWLPKISASLERGSAEIERGTRTTFGDTEEQSVSVNQPLFKGGESVAKYTQAKNIIAAAHARLAETEQTILLDAIRAYMEVVTNQEILALSTSNENVLKEHAFVTDERFRLGEVTKTDVAQAKARFAGATSERIQAAGNLQVALANFKRIIGQEAKDLTIPQKHVAVEADQEKLIAMALENNPSVLYAKYSELTAKSDIKINKARLLPSLSFNASQSRQRSGEVLFLSDQVEQGVAAINLSVPLYQGGAQYSRVRQSAYTAEQKKYDLIEAQNAVRENVITAYQQLDVAIATITSSEAAVEAAKIALSGVEYEAKAGARTTLDILDAERELLDVQITLTKAKRDKIISAYSLLAQIGRLNAKNLDLKVTSFDPEEHYKKTKFKVLGF